MIRSAAVLVSGLPLRGFGAEAAGPNPSGLIERDRDQEGRGFLPGRDEVQARDLHTWTWIFPGDDIEPNCPLMDLTGTTQEAPGDGGVLLAGRRAVQFSASRSRTSGRSSTVPSA